jgi:hypothetical protein
MPARIEERHPVIPEEAEDVFFHEPLVSKREQRYYSLGQTRIGRMLFVSFTIRQQLIRVTSVRERADCLLHNPPYPKLKPRRGRCRFLAAALR